jgi:uncharacterized membrane protein
MDDERIREQFKKSIKYKRMGFLTILLATIPLMIFEGPMKYILVIIIFGVGVYFERQYKCPACGYVFDTRVKSDELKYCPKCSKRLQN